MKLFCSKISVSNCNRNRFGSRLTQHPESYTIPVDLLVGLYFHEIICIVPTVLQLTDLIKDLGRFKLRNDLV